MIDSFLLFVLDITIRFFKGKKQFLPTFEELSNKEIKELSKRLKEKSIKETLNNVLEWQHRNLLYWVERGYLESSLQLFICLGYFFIFAFISIPIFIFIYIFLTKFFIFPHQIALISSTIIFSFFLWIILRANTALKLIYLILCSYPVYELIKVVMLKSLTLTIISLLLNLTIINWMIFGISLFSLCYLFIIYRSFASQEISIINKFKKIWKLITLTFEFSLPIQEILKYRMAICRDYAKFTATLLYNLFPKNKIYFLTFLGHSACAIEIKNKVYVLDQKLPILTLEKWLLKWKKEKINIYLMKVKNKKIEIKKINLPSFQSTTINNFEKLENNLKSAIKIRKPLKNEKIMKFKFSLPNFATYYEDDEIIRDSFVRAIKYKIKNEFCGSVSKIVDIKIKQNKKDLGVEVYFVAN